jgi:two-component SAPR family response regulator
MSAVDKFGLPGENDMLYVMQPASDDHLYRVIDRTSNLVIASIKIERMMPTTAEQRMVLVMAMVENLQEDDEAHEVLDEIYGCIGQH